MSKKSAITATVGFFIVGSCIWMHSLPVAGWIDMASVGSGAGAVPLALVLAVVGILAFLQEETADSVIFLAFAALVWSHHPAHGGAAPGAMAAGWGLLLWTVFFLYVWCGTRKGGGTRSWFLLAFWLSLLAEVIHHWHDIHILAVVSGYLGLIAGVLALLASAKAIGCGGGSGASAS